jgi:hypothetical protein
MARRHIKFQGSAYPAVSCSYESVLDSSRLVISLLSSSVCADTSEALASISLSTLPATNA